MTSRDGGPPDDVDDTSGHLLVVDDNEMNRDMLSRRLARRGHRVVTAEDGRTALALIEQQPFDVVLLDIMMPGIDGLEVLKTVRQTHPAAELPVIMATARDESADITGALAAGANDYVTKPLDFQVVLARVQTQVSLKRARDALGAAHDRMKSDLEEAATVQRALLPGSPPVTDRARFAWEYRPCDELAGDSLDVFAIDARHIGMYVLDVTGHGVPAALLSVSVTHALARRGAGSVVTGGEDAPHSIASPACVAARLNRLFPMRKRTRRCFGLTYGVLDTQSGRFQFVCAGQPEPMVVRSDGSAERLDAPGLPIGVLRDAVFDNTSVDLRPGDRVFLHSDGVHEQRSPAGELFGLARMHHALAASRSQPLGTALSSLVDAVAAWTGGGRFSDDISLLAAEIVAA